MKLPRLVNRAIQKTILHVLPSNRRLPLRYALHIAAGDYELELRYFEKIHRVCPRHDIAIDIGANDGFFSYRMAALFSRVVAFEINGRLVGDLAAYNPGNIEIHTVGLASEPGTVEFFIPVMNGIRLDSWGSLSPGNCPDTNEHETMAVRVETLDSFAISPVSFIKIDVEGHEMGVLRGGIETLKKSRPVLLIEVKEPNRAEVQAFMAALDYREISIYAETPSQENRIFVPNEH